MTDDNCQTLLSELRIIAEADEQADCGYHERLSWAFHQGHINRLEYDELMRFVAGDDYDDEPPLAEFDLTNEPPKPKPWRPENVKAKQRVLLAGLDCLEGQGNLFDTDGEEDSDE